MNVNAERASQVGDKLSAIGNVEELVKDGRVPIKLQAAALGEIEKPEWDSIIFYNVPPKGFTLGKNGCTGKVDPITLSVEYFDGQGKSLGGGELIGVRFTEAMQMDKKIEEARQQFGY